MLNCRQVTERASAMVDGELSSRERLSMRMHLLMCVHCRRFQRHLQGMVSALEPRKRGRQVTSESRIEKLEQEIERLSGEVLRYQTLHRASQRVIGVPREEPAAPASRRKEKKTTRARRRKSRAEKILPRVAPEKGDESPPARRAGADASTQEV